MPLTPEQKERLRDDAKFQALIARHPHRQSEFNAAVDQLAEHPDIGSDAECCAAVCNAGSAIGCGIRIFVSYKVGQSEAAEALLKPFRLLGNGRIFNEHPFPFLCERAGLDGMQYKASIHAALEDTHWFFLLLPDESLDRSWTMFEAGFFRRAMQPGDRLICIHHESVKPAGPLEDFDKVFAKEEEVLDLLHTLLVRPRAMPGMSPISPGLSRDDLRPHAVEIVRRIVPKRDTRRDHYIKFVDLGLEGCSEDYNADALRQAPIIGHRSLGDLFGYRIDGNPHSSIKLGEVIKRSDADADEHDWVHDVARAIAAAASSKKPDPVEACFRGRDQRLYRPTLHSLDRYADTNKPKSAHIVFQAVPRPTTGSAPRHLTQIAVALRLGYRFRHEILDTFREVTGADEVRHVERIMTRLERDARQRGLSRPVEPQDDFSRHPVVLAFPADQRAEVEACLRQWRIYRDGSGGRLDLAFRALDADETIACLEDLRPINARFMRLAARRYADLVAQHWPDS